MSGRGMTGTGEKVTPCGMSRIELLHGALTKSVIESFYESYDHLGYGFLEHLCARALDDELRARGHRVAREVSVPVHYKGREIGTQRIDMIVDDVLVVEVKAIEALTPASFRQVHNYLRATRLELGLILNFGPRPSFQRVIYTNDHKLWLPDRSSDARRRR